MRVKDASEFGHSENRRDELFTWPKDALVDKIIQDEEKLKVGRDTIHSLSILEAIHGVQTDYLNVESEVNIFHQMLDALLSITKSEYGFIYELFYAEDGGKYLEVRSITNIAWDGASRALYGKLLSGEVRFDNPNSLYGEVMKTGRPYFTNQARMDPKRAGVPKGHPALDRFLGIPMHAGGEYVGMIGLANGKDGYSEKTVKQLAPLTKISAIIMMSFKTEQKRKAALAESRALALELESANQELEQFVYAASHDLKAPLRAISNLACWIEEDLGEALDGEPRENLDLMKRRVARMGSLLDDLLAYSLAGKDQKPMEVVSVREVVENLAELFVDNSRELHMSGTRDLPTLTTQKAALEFVFRNLIDNAIKHHDGRVVNLDVSAELVGDFYRFSVKDDGPGIPPEYHDKMFKMFKTLKSRDEVEGSGMGLAIVQKLVALQGGEIHVQSEVGRRGSCFVFDWQSGKIG